MDFLDHEKISWRRLTYFLKSVFLSILGIYFVQSKCSQNRFIISGGTELAGCHAAYLTKCWSKFNFNRSFLQRNKVGIVRENERPYLNYSTAIEN